MFSLLKKEIQLEWRQKHALAGVLLYVLATVFVCYLALQSIEAPDVWNALLWITALFTAFNALQRTFH
ncbi:MAG: ABC transporter permease, partial [Bacteroidota bacterium]